MSLKGDFNSATANLLVMRLEKCRETESLKCKTDDEITQFLRNKWLLIIYNERFFDSNNYGSESIVNKSNVLWLNVNT